MNAPELQQATVAAAEPPQPDPAEEFISDYWAACPTEEIAEEAMAKVNRYFTYLVSSNLSELWRKAYRARYGMRQNTGVSGGWGIFDVGKLFAAGDQGEIVRVKVNHFANLITHQHVMTTSTRPALACRAINSDSDSLIAAQLGDGIVEYFMRERKIEQRVTHAVDIALTLSEGYVVLGWDATAGKQYGAGPHGAPLFDGDVTATNFTGFQVAKDVNKLSDDEQLWYITKSKRNKYDLMAKHKGLANKINALKTDDQNATSKTAADPSKTIAATSFGTEDTDDVPYYELYHKVTDAVPEGRYTIFCSADVCLFDGPLPFREIPVYRVAPQNVIGTPFAWTIAFDILGLQELVDKLYTIWASNVMGGGMQNVWCPPNSGLTVEQIAGGFNLLESAIKPEVLQLLADCSSIEKMIAKVESVLEVLTGVSSINRGDIPTADMSGSAMAFMASQAITFSSGLQQSYNLLLEGVGTGLINILKDFAKTPRMAIIAGKFNRPLMKTFTGSQLAPINNVVCDATSALSKTTAGKITIAQDLLKAGVVTAHEYITLVQTGQLEPMTRGPQMESFLIQQENEELLHGVNPPVLKTDKHAQHIEEHRSVISSPDARRNLKLVQATLQHLSDHEATQIQLQHQEPALLAATGQQPLPEPQPPMPPQPPPPGPGTGPGAQPNAGGLAATLNPANPAAQKAGEVKQPHMPNLPKGADQQTQASYATIKGAA